MAEFLLLGQIPGTSIQITFWMWWLSLSILATSYMFWHLLIASQRLWVARLYLSLRRSRSLARRLYLAEL
jgi:hypothetical protein